MEYLLFISVFVIATCGLVYELIAGTLASYLLGDSVTQFSTVIGTYLFAMGVGSWLSRYVTRNLLGFFIAVEILVGFIGGSSAALLFVMFEFVSSFRFLLYFMVSVIGVLVGVEIPVLLRILQDRLEFKDLVSKVFTFDYIGALFASILFPMVLVPYLGLVKSAFLFGILNSLVAVWVLYGMGNQLGGAKYYKISAIAVLIYLIFGFVYSDKIVSFAETNAYHGNIIFAKSSPYQRLVLTKQGHDLRLFLNANLQFSSTDEYRYHEALVHPAMASVKDPKSVLVIGGGDGLAVREILKYPSVKKIVMVDLDPEMTRLFSSHELLTALNQNALKSEKLKIYNEDAFMWLKDIKDNPQRPNFDVVIIDVPDPSNFSVGKLYSVTFFKLLKNVLHEGSIFVVQSTSPLIARKSYWCVFNTVQSSGFLASAYHAYVPSFGEWGFVIGTFKPYVRPEKYLSDLKYMSVETADQMFYFPPDMAHVDTQIQRLDDQVLIRYFDEEWSRYLVY